MPSAQFSDTIRTYHRYLGYFLAGIMLLYACSGVLLIFRKTTFMKFDVHYEYQLTPGLSVIELLSTLNVKGLVAESETEQAIQLTMGNYNKQSGLTELTVKEYPLVIDRVVHLHKASTKSPLFLLNIFFGSGLLFFALSAFFIFPPNAAALKSGLKVAVVGFAMALLVVTFG